METHLYRYYDEAGELLYVGVTGNLLKRQSQHRRNAEWFTTAASATFEHFESREMALEAESRAIKNENPKYNIAKTPRNSFVHSPFTHMLFLAGMPDGGHDFLHKEYCDEYVRIFIAFDGNFPNKDMVMVAAMNFARAKRPEAKNLTDCDNCVRAFSSEWYKQADKRLKRSK
jgi:predicted GIY-YIG superfamily endonuclease